MLSKLSVRKPFTVIVSVIIIMILGVVSYLNIGIDLLPGMNMPFVAVITVYPGAEPETVETEITDTLEAGLSEVSNIKSMSSNSSEHFSTIWMEFNAKADVDKCYNDVKDKLELISLPDNPMIQKPIVMKIDPNMLPVFSASIAVEGQNIKESNKTLQAAIDKLKSVDGVSSVTESGLVDNLAYITMSIDKLCDKVVEFLHDTYGIDVKLGTISKRAMLSDFKNMDLDDKTPEDVIDQIISSLENNSTGSEIAWVNFAINYLEDSKEDPESVVYKRCEDLLLNQYMFDDNVDEDIFFSFVDNLTDAIYDGYVASYVSSILNSVTTDTMGMLITAQDFEMPAGAITEGVIQTVVKIGPSTLSREEFMNTPLISMDLGQTFQQQFDMIYAYLDILSYTSSTDEVSFNKSQLISYIHTARETNSEMFGSGTDEEVAVQFINILILVESMNNTGSITLPEEDAGDSGIYKINIPLLRKDIEVLQDQMVMELAINNIANVTFFDNSASTLTYMLNQVKNGDEVDFESSGAVIFNVNKESDKSTVELTNSLKETLQQMSESEEFEGLTYSVLSDDGQSINYMLDTVVSNLLWGAGLAIIILLLFLRNMKATLVVGSSIFISVVATFVMMYFANITLNIVSMGGLALGVGMLVDNSIVVIENIYRMKMQGKSIYESAIYGAKQVGGAIISSTLTTVVVFLPIAFIQGMTKELFSDMALTICFSLLASLVVALSLVPMASSFMLKKPLKKEPKMVGKLKKVYVRSLNFNLNHKYIAIVLIAIMATGAVFAALNMDTVMFPETDSGNLTITTQIDREGLAKYNDRVGVENALTYDEAIEFAMKQMENTITGKVMIKEFDDNPDSDLVAYSTKNDDSWVDAIAGIGIHIDQGMVIAGQSLGGNDIVANVVLKPSNERNIGSVFLTKEFDRLLNKKEINQGIFMASSSGGGMMEGLGLTQTSFKFQVYGEDLDLMRSQANEFIKSIETSSNKYSIDGITDMYISGDQEKTEYRIIVNREKANHYGLTVAQVYQQVAEALGSAKSTNTLELYENNEKVNRDVYVYSSSYKTNVWYEGINAESGDKTDVYFKNNIANINGKTSFYVPNNKERGIFVKDNGQFIYIPENGEIPLVLNDDDSYSYSYINAENEENIKENTININLKTNEINYNTALKKDFDLITMNINSADLMNTGAEMEVVPLYSVLDDSCFVRNDNDEIIYRSSILGSTQLIPSALKTTPSYNTISHLDKKKVITIVAEYGEGVNSNDMESDFEKAISGFTFEDGISVTLNKGNEYVNEVYSTLYLILGLAIILIYLVMVAQFQSLKSPFIIMFTLPLAFIGGIYGIFVAQQPISVMALMGLIVLVGVVVNNGIVFVDYCNQLIRNGVSKRVALLRTGMDRIRPILMTALTTIIALVVMAFDSSEGGAMLQPLAITAIGGMIFSTALTLFIVPIIFDIFNRNAHQTDRDKAFANGKFDEDLVDQNVTDWDNENRDFIYSLKGVETMPIIEKDNQNEELNDSKANDDMNTFYNENDDSVNNNKIENYEIIEKKVNNQSNDEEPEIKTNKRFNQQKLDELKEKRDRLFGK
ncbi:MAG: efflux RND transporter permease subunit [Clostridia bacterium]